MSNKDKSSPNMEIERKFIPKKLPDHLDQYPFHDIEQGYLCTNPTIRIRKMDNDCFLTYKSSGMMAHQEYEVSLTLEGITLAEVEFTSVEEANAFLAPDWFGEDVTYDSRYHNSEMSKGALLVSENDSFRISGGSV